MKNILKTITAITLAFVMAAISPLTDLSTSVNGETNNGGAAKAATVAKAAETGGQLYISDIKIGNAYTESEADPDEGMKDEAAVAAELESEGYTILRDGNAYANLNDGAGSKSGLKKGANDKIILLGYKTTTNPKEAITDLAVMNMNGGYSVEDYETLLKTQMESRIRPFVDQFIAAINEYRENYKKPEDTVNHKRADQSRRMMNLLTDDDTGGQPIGDLLLNETKYEMGDAAYNKLSAEEKKNHADILTMLLQGNSKAVLTIETCLSKATDTSEEDTWLERFMETSLDDLVEEVKEKNPSLTTKKEIYSVLDKKYQDKAKELQKKWRAAADVFNEAEDMGDEALDSIEERGDIEVPEALDSIETEEEAEEASDELVATIEEYTDSMEDVAKLQVAVLADSLEQIEYEGGTLLDFFRGEGTYKDDDVRTLYPVVASLSEGQKQGLDFLSVSDLLSIALNDGENMNPDDLGDVGTTSVYEGVNRETFEKNAVAMTNEALRKKNADALAEVTDPTDASVLQTSTWILWGASTLSAIGTIALGILAKNFTGTTTTTVVTPLGEKISEVMGESMFNLMKRTGGLQKYISSTKASMEAGIYSESVKNIVEKNVAKAQEISDEFAGKYTELEMQQVVTGGTNYYKYFFAGAMVLTVVLIGISIWSTLDDMSTAYDIQFKTIPKYMVDEVDITAFNEKGEKIFVNNQSAYYKAVTCNRVDGTTENEKNNHKELLDRADLNGDIGKQWVALYYVKNENGYPILADSLLYRKGGGDMPSGYSTGIHEFGGKAAVNLNKKIYLFPDDPPAIHVFYKNAEMSVSGLMSTTVSKDKDMKSDEDSDSDTDKGSVSGAAGSIIAEGSDSSGSGITAAGVALGGGIGIVLGALLMALIMYFSRRKKREE